MKVSTAIEKVYALGSNRQVVKVGYAFEREVKNALDEMTRKIGHNDTKLIQAAVLMMHEQVCAGINGSTKEEIKDNTTKNLMENHNMMMPGNSHFRWGVRTAEELCEKMRSDPKLAAQVKETNIRIYGHNPDCYQIEDNG